MTICCALCVNMDAHVRWHLKVQYVVFFWFGWGRELNTASYFYFVYNCRTILSIRLSSFRLCSEDLIPLWGQLLYSFLEIWEIHIPEFVLLSYQYWKYYLSLVLTLNFSFFKTTVIVHHEVVLKFKEEWNKSEEDLKGMITNFTVSCGKHKQRPITYIILFARVWCYWEMSRFLFEFTDLMEAKHLFFSSHNNGTV